MYMQHMDFKWHDYGRLAQLVEQVTFNHWVTGSNPVPLTILNRDIHQCGWHIPVFLCK